MGTSVFGWIEARGSDVKSRPHIMIVETATELAERAGRVFLEAAREAVAVRDRFLAGLAGGTTPRGMHRILGRDPLRSKIPWQATHLYWGDERCVPVHSPKSNYGLAREDLLRHIDIPENHVHPMPFGMEPESAAARYEEELPLVLDLLFLGLGKDGHTASLFPGHDALKEQKRGVVAVKGGDPMMERLTLTLPAINRARQVVFLVGGREKSIAVQTVLEDSQPLLPAARVRPADGSLSWILDKEAASRLTRISRV